MKKRQCNEDSSVSMDDMPFKERIWSVQIQNKQIILNGDITEDVIEKAVIQIFNYNQIDDEQEKNIVGYNREPIYIFINSSGGLLDEAFSLISAIETSKTQVYTVALGKACSAAFLILLAGHYRFAQKYTNMMLHQLSAGVVGECKTITDYAQYYKKVNDKAFEYIHRKTKIPKKKLTDVFNNKHDWFFDTNEALLYKMVDDVI